MKISIGARLKLWFSCFCLLPCFYAAAQHTELNAVFNSGFYSFAGSGVGYETIFNLNSANGQGYANNPYGSKADLSYGLSANLKYISASNFITGADLGFEVLRSKSEITMVGSSAANGKSVLNQNFINLYPFLGYRIHAPMVSVDFLLGLDLAYLATAKEKDEATVIGGASYSNVYDRELIDFDFRPRAQIGVNYQKLGIYAGYSVGLIDYRANLLYAPYPGAKSTNSSAKASFIRFGVSYRLK